MDDASREPVQTQGGRLALKLFFAAVCASAALLPQTALAATGGSIEGVLCNVLEDLSGPTGYAIATAIVITVGISALLGKISTIPALTVVVGLALLFGAGSIVTALGGEGDACFDITIVANPGAYTGQNAIDYCNTLFYPNGTGDTGATGATGTGTATGTGSQTFQPANGIALPIIECFTDPDNGIIPTYTEAFLASTQAYFIPLVSIMATLTVTFFGLKLMAGNVPRVKAESFVLLFKIAGVFYFLTAAQTIYPELLAILGGLGDAISNASVSLNPNGFCNTTTGADGLVVANDLWGRWDCVLGYIFGFTPNGANGAGAGNGSIIPDMAIAAFLLKLLFNSGIGIAIFFLGVYCVLALAFALIRFLYIYIMAVLAFSFLFVFGYLFVPMMLFKGTKDYFDKWLQIVLAYLLMPVIMLGYMGMMLVLFDTVFYSGPNSVWSLVDPPDNTAGGGAPTTNIFDTVVSKHSQDQMFGLMYPDYGNIGVAQQDNNMQNVNAGVTGTNVRDLNFPASCFMATPAATAPAAGIDTSTLDVFGNQNQNPPANANCPQATNNNNNPAPPADNGLGGNTYLTNLLTAFASAALLIYVMYSLLSYIPQMAAGLVSQGTAAGSMMAQSPLFGQGMSNSMAGYAQKMMSSVGGGGNQMLQNAMKMVTGR